MPVLVGVQHAAGVQGTITITTLDLGDASNNALSEVFMKNT